MFPGLALIFTVFWTTTWLSKKENLSKRMIKQILLTQVVWIAPVYSAISRIEYIREFEWLQDFVFIVVSITFQEVSFYCLHRLAHTEMFYKKVHRQHHEPTGFVGVNAIYAHPIEIVVIDLLPIMLPLTFMPHHYLTGLLWLATAVWTTVRHHSLEEEGAFHRRHHKYSNCNYGFVFMDKLCGTSREID
jgi:sterol desaturase/sphingolipid hydroxylase (fatty acid hydroxylase superfamily)